MAIPPNFYNVADQKLYNEGIFYKPQERYTLPYNQVSFDNENLVEPDGILSASAVNNFNSNGLIRMVLIRMVLILTILVIWETIEI